MGLLGVYLRHVKNFAQIGRILKFIKTNHKLTVAEKHKKPPLTLKLLNEWYKLHVQYAANSLGLYSSTGTTYDVLEPEHNVALYDALSSRTAVATMGSALSVVSVQINSDFCFFCFVHYLVRKKKEISLVYLNILCVDAVNAILK